LSRQLEWGLQEKCFKVLKAVQDAFFHFFSMLLNGGKIKGSHDNLKEGFTSFFYFSSRDSIGVHAKISTIS
jgi:hypothetical protein